MDQMQWEEPVTQGPVTLEKMDELGLRIKTLRDQIDERNKETKKLDEQLDKLEHEMIALLKANNRTSYQVPGVGICMVRTVESYQTPKDNESKIALFDYIENKYGTDVLTNLVSINSRTLNSWANKETEDGGVMQIPGLGQPTVSEVFSFRKG